MAMIHAGIRDFRDRATRYLAGNDVIAIERHGKTVGFYIPVPNRDEEKGRRALAELQQAVRQAMADTGLSEDQLADLFDLSKPLD
jgi:hypothetical protein